MKTEGVRKIQLVWLALTGLGLFAGLCTIFVLLVTLAPDNLRLLKVTAGICALLLAIAGLTRSSYGVVGTGAR
jgi:hypothetical protein